jgi:hypothetical protein
MNEIKEVDTTNQRDVYTPEPHSIKLTCVTLDDIYTSYDESYNTLIKYVDEHPAIYDICKDKCYKSIPNGSNVILKLNINSINVIDEISDVENKCRIIYEHLGTANMIGFDTESNFRSDEISLLQICLYTNHDNYSVHIIRHNVFNDPRIQEMLKHVFIDAKLPIVGGALSNDIKYFKDVLGRVPHQLVDVNLVKNESKTELKSRMPSHQFISLSGQCLTYLGIHMNLCRMYINDDKYVCSTFYDWKDDELNELQLYYASLDVIIPCIIHQVNNLKVYRSDDYILLTNEISNYYKSKTSRTRTSKTRGHIINLVNDMFIIIPITLSDDGYLKYTSAPMSDIVDPLYGFTINGDHERTIELFGHKVHNYDIHCQTSYKHIYLSYDIYDRHRMWHGSLNVLYFYIPSLGEFKRYDHAQPVESHIGGGDSYGLFGMFDVLNGTLNKITSVFRTK